MSNKPENVKCPDCGGEMKSRNGQYGKFWGCASYPKCKGTRNSMGRSKADREEWKREQSEKDGVNLVNDDSPSDDSPSNDNLAKESEYSFNKKRN